MAVKNVAKIALFSKKIWKISKKALYLHPQTQQLKNNDYDNEEKIQNQS